RPHRLPGDLEVIRLLACCLLLTSLGTAQGPTDSWPTYNGDYSGRRFSSLKQIQASNLHSLSLAWSYRITVPGGAMRGIGEPVIKSTPLMVNGILYFTIPDHVFAVDARTGLQLWQYDWVDKGG